MLSILGSHCGEGAAPSPAPPPAFIYTPSIYASIPARHYLQTIHPSTHQTSKQPTNQATQTTQPCFPQMLSILGLHCGEGAAPSLRTPSRLYLHRSIHPSINQAHKQKDCISIKHCITQAITASKPSNQRAKELHFCPVHDPSITVCVFTKSKQPTSQAG